MFRKIKDLPRLEVRFIVAVLDTEIFQCEVHEIIQGYINASFSESLSVRLIDRNRAIVSFKIGRGKLRQEQEWEVPLWLGYALLHCCRDRIIHKVRYLRDGWLVDVYADDLRGLVMAERDIKSLEDSIEPPSWLKLDKDVTSWLSNRELAELVREIQNHPVVGSLRQYICDRYVPREPWI